MKIVCQPCGRGAEGLLIGTRVKVVVEKVFQSVNLQILQSSAHVGSTGGNDPQQIRVGPDPIAVPLVVVMLRPHSDGDWRQRLPGRLGNGGGRVAVRWQQPKMSRNHTGRETGRGTGADRNISELGVAR